VIGINTAIINYAQSIGFAIPSNIVRKVVAELLKFGEVQRGWLGVGIEEVSREIAQKANAKAGEGVRVNSVFEGDPAHRAGLRIGDIILKIGGADVDTPSRMIRLIGSFSPGQTISLDILRDGKREVVSVKLENQKFKRDKVVKKNLPDPSEPSLGLEVESVTDGNGLIVSRVYPGSTAAQEGLQEGDRIEAINGKMVSEVTEFKDALDSISSGGRAHLLVQRNKEKFHLALVQ
jgi:serine protease Do